MCPGEPFQGSLNAATKFDVWHIATSYAIGGVGWTLRLVLFRWNGQTLCAQRVTILRLACQVSHG